jgi:hypothetical protein
MRAAMCASAAVNRRSMGHADAPLRSIVVSSGNGCSARRLCVRPRVGSECAESSAVAECSATAVRKARAECESYLLTPLAELRRVFQLASVKNRENGRVVPETHPIGSNV